MSPLHSQFHKVAEELEAGVAGFFGVELDAHDVIALDGCGEGAAVVGGGGSVGVDGGAPAVGVVDEAAGGDVFEQAAVGTDVFEGVPADVGRFKRLAFVDGGEAFARAAEVAESVGGFGFGAACVEPLEADADAEEGDASGDGVAGGFCELEVVQELGGAEVAYAGEYDFGGVADVRG